MNILHIATEFRAARSGGLGAAVDDITGLQAARGDDVHVVLPWFQDDSGRATYPFQDPADAVSRRPLVATDGDDVWSAEVLQHRLPVKGSDAHVTLTSVRPLQTHAWLTTIRSQKNPYKLSDRAFADGLDAVGQNAPDIRDAKGQIVEMLARFRSAERRFDRISNTLSELEDASKHTKAPIDLGPGAPSSDAVQARAAKLRDGYIAKLRGDKERWSVRKQDLLKRPLGHGKNLAETMYRVANDKAYRLSCFAAAAAADLTHRRPLDVIHTHYFGLETKLIPDLLAPGVVRPALVKSLHSLNVRLTELAGREHPIRAGLRHADAVHVVSEGSYQELEEDIRSGRHAIPESEAVDLNKVLVAPNGIDTAKFALGAAWTTSLGQHASLSRMPGAAAFAKLDPRQQKLLFKKALATAAPKADLRATSWIQTYDPDAPLMLFVGRFCAAKAHHRLFVAADVARQSGAQLAIMGYGDKAFEAKLSADYPDVALLSDKADQRRIGSLVRGAADFCLLTSNRETAGLVLLEGQSMGQSVITSDLPGPRSLANPDAARFFPLVSHPDVARKPGGFGHLDEDATRAGFRRVLDAALTRRAESSDRAVVQEIRSNMQFAGRFTSAHMVERLDRVYAHATAQRDARAPKHGR